MGIITRVLRICKADIHGVMDQLEDKELLLKQYLRDMAEALEQKEARLKKMNLSRSHAVRKRDKYNQDIEKLDQDLEVAIKRDKDNLYILDEPTTGLHLADIQRLLDIINRLVDEGNTVIVIEHNLDVIKTADHVIELGPEGGKLGGRIVAQGTPEEVAKVKDSYTGQYLKSHLAYK